MRQNGANFRARGQGGLPERRLGDRRGLMMAGKLRPNTARSRRTAIRRLVAVRPRLLARSPRPDQTLTRWMKSHVIVMVSVRTPEVVDIPVSTFCGQASVR